MGVAVVGYIESTLHDVCMHDIFPPSGGGAAYRKVSAAAGGGERLEERT